MTPADAGDLLRDLTEETARLRDPAELQFVGGDVEADARTAEALSAQLDGVPALRVQAPALAEASGRTVDDVLGVVRGYAEATGDALERVRAGRAPARPPRVQTAPRDAEASGHGGGMGAGGPSKPSLLLPVLVAVVILVVAVVVVTLLL